jgi:hypothetical protein
MRRRVWWQILFVDGRLSQVSGYTLAFELLNVPLPANLNDADMNPNMRTTPPAHDGPTEMIFVLSRYEFGLFLMANGKRLHNTATPLAERDALIDELEAKLARKYLRHCDPGIITHELAGRGARSAICRLRLMAHHPSQHRDKGASLPQSEHDILFATAVEMIDLMVSGHETVGRGLERFTWHTHVYFQLDALVFMLIESRHQNADSPRVEKAWRLVEETYRYKPELLGEDDLHKAVRALVLKAWGAREIEMRRLGLALPSPLPIIERLRDMTLPSWPTQRDIPATTEGAGIVRPDETYGMAAGAITLTMTTNTLPAQDARMDGEEGQLNDSFGHGMDDATVLGWENTDWQSWDYWTELLNLHIPPGQ